MKKRIIRITESDIKNIVKNAAMRIISEVNGDGMEDGTSDIEQVVRNYIAENASDFDMLNYENVEEITQEELADAVSDLIKACVNDSIQEEDLMVYVGASAVRIEGDLLWVEDEENGEESYERWDGDVREIVISSYNNGDLDYIIQTLAQSINSCWYENHSDELDDSEYMNGDFGYDENYE